MLAVIGVQDERHRALPEILLADHLPQVQERTANW
jgi:hypothetical protein